MIWRRLWRDERGGIAILVALALPVLLGVGALGVDVVSLQFAKTRMQTAVDAAALAGAQALGDQATARRTAVDFAAANVPTNYGVVTQDADVEFGAYDPATRTFVASNVNVNALRVTARREPERGNAAPRFLSRIWGAQGATIRVQAIAARLITTSYSAPELFDLAPEAGDYNEVYAYCFDPAGSGAAESRRTQMTLVARNIAPPVRFVWPTCAAGQTLSFRLRNVRDSKREAQLGRPLPGAQFNHFSDTVMVDGREVFDFAGRAILETMRCDTQAECRQTRVGGVVPAGPGRTPNRETRLCVPGKFMYFGWEDRPPGLGWTDQDYDDIVFVLRCPTGLSVAYGATRLVR